MTYIENVKAPVVRKGREPMLRLLLKKSGGLCWYCGRRLRYDPFRADHVTADHVLPKSLGGSDADDNLVPCCRPCNSLKGNPAVELLRHHLAQRALKWPAFSREHIVWLRRMGTNLDFAAYDNFKFWFETEGKTLASPVRLAAPVRRAG